MISTAMGLMMLDRLKMLMQVASLYLNRQKGRDLLRQIKASDLSENDHDRIVDIMRRMRIIGEADVQACDWPEVLSLPPSSSASKAQRQVKG